ncbi:MAG TPA: hypothetical protein PK245_01800 [Clostridia bacterium]|nr:hypothetical protein [Clostridia bacterium]HRU84613.1 hypothetical protein [Eubacteriales bacterium]
MGFEGADNPFEEFETDKENAIKEGEKADAAEIFEFEEREVTSEAATKFEAEAEANEGDGSDGGSGKKRKKPRVKYRDKSDAEKKKFKKRLIILISVLSVFVIIGSVLLWLFWGLIINKALNSDLGSYYGLFGYAPQTDEDSIYTDYSAQFELFSTEIEAAMEDDATPEQKALAAYIIYRIACLADATSPMRAKFTVGLGRATGGMTMNDTSIEISGGMDLTATYYDLIYPFNAKIAIADRYTDAYKVYSVSEEYTQVPKDSVAASDESLVSIGELGLRSLLPFARRRIKTPEKQVVWTGDALTTAITKTGVTADFSEAQRNFDIKSRAEYEAAEAEFTRPYPDDYGDPYGLSAHDISVHVITPDVVMGDTVKIEKKSGTKIGDSIIEYYSVDFEVDTLSGRGTEECASYYAEKLYLSQAPGIFLDILKDYSLYYGKLKVNMTVFTNGYMRTWTTEEVWEMSGKVDLGILKATASVTSKNDSTEAYCYDYDTIMQGFVNRWYGDIDKVNYKMSSLPFYSLLKEFQKQAYGSYR